MKIKEIYMCMLLGVLIFFSNCTGKEKVELKVKEEAKKVEVTINGKLFTSYMYPDNIMKPVLWPIISPAGNTLTRSFPLQIKEGERTDHPHHIGVWFNYGNVNGLDFWNNSEAIPAEEKQNYGTIYHRSIDRNENGNGKGSLEITADWKSPDNIILLEEHTRFDFIADKKIRIIDRTTTLTAMFDTVTFIDNKEGMFGVRVAREMELPSKGAVKMVDSHGNITTVENMNNDNVKGNYHSADGVEGKDVWGTRCRWMKLSSEIKGEEVALVIIDHPDNVGYPTYWHARDYGLFAANPLGQKVFSKGKNELNFSMKKGEKTTFKYRLIVAGEDLSDQQINELADNFAKK